MGQRAGEGGAGSQHPVDLAQHPIDVGDPAQLEGGQGDIDGISPHEGQLGKVALMEFDPDLMGLGEITGGLDVAQIVIDPDDMGALPGQCDHVVTPAGSQDEHASTLGVAEQTERTLVRDIGAVGHDIGGEVRRRRECGRRWTGRESGL